MKNKLTISWLCSLLFACFTAIACRVPEQFVDNTLGDLRYKTPNPQVDKDVPGLCVALAPEPNFDLNQEDILENLSLRDAELKDVLRSFFAESDLNLIIDENITGKVTFDFHNTSISEAFLSILDHNGLGFRHDGSFVRVSDKEQRIFKINYLSGNAASTNTASTSSATSTDVLQTQTAAVGAATTIWDKLSKDLKDLAGDATDKDTTIVINSTTGTIVVTGPTDKLKEIEKYLDEVQETISRQVMIEARLIEVTLDDTFSTGVNYSILPGFLNSDEQGTLSSLGIGSTEDAFFQQVGGASSGSNGIRFGLLKPNKFDVLISALQTQGQVRILSAPRVATLNNVPATIQLQRQIPVIQTENTTSTVTTVTVQNISFKDAGIKIDVTPQITDSGEIWAQINPSITEVAQTIFTEDGSQAPVLNTRATNATLHVRDGQSIILGGIRSVRKNESNQGIPILMDIPFLGALFRSNFVEQSETELVVLMTPTILHSQELQELVRDGLSRIERVTIPYHLTPLNLNNAENQSFSIEPPDQSSPVYRSFIPEAASSAGQIISRKGLANLFLQRGIQAYQDKHFFEANSLLRRSQFFDPLQGEVEIYLGLIALESGDRKTAKQHFEKQLKINPNDPTALNNRGILELLDGHPLIGEPYLRKAAALVPNDANLRNNLGLAYALLSYNEQARIEYERAIEMNSGHAESHFNLARLFDAEAAFPEDAIPHYEAYLEAMPKQTKLQAQVAARRLRWLRDGLQ